MPTLEFRDGRSVPVFDGMVIGRVSACDVVLEDEKVSRKHARIVFQGGVAEVEDLGSRNGVFLNGNRILRRVLRDGDLLTVGRVELAFRDTTPVAEESASPPPAAPLPAPAEPDVAAEPPADVEILEFVDEVVEVRRRPGPEARPRQAARAEAPRQNHGVLQFSSQSERGVLSEDVGQLGGLRRLLVVLAAVAFAVGIGWVAMTLAS